jgi:hypothetical protein
VFSSNSIAPGVSFAAALRGGAAQQQRPQAGQQPVATPPTVVEPNPPAPGHKELSGQSVRPRTVNSQTFDNTLKVVTVVQQITTEFNGAVSEEGKMMAKNQNSFKPHEE